MEYCHFLKEDGDFDQKKKKNHLLIETEGCALLKW